MLLPTHLSHSAKSIPQVNCDRKKNEFIHRIGTYSVVFFTYNYFEFIHVGR